MKKRLMKKLNSRAGESIAEVLVALLISALALVMLASMITASTRIITQSKTTMESYYAENNTLELRTAESSLAGTVSIKNGSSDVYLVYGQSPLNPIQVKYYKNSHSTKTQVVSYK